MIRTYSATGWIEHFVLEPKNFATAIQVTVFPCGIEVMDQESE
jgi:hypothetical protein